VPHISYITRGKLSDVVKRQFDCVVSSHMIEHSPDLITHLREVRSVLKPGGAFLFLCPDKRRGPEQFLPESRLPEVVTAFLEQRTRPTLRSVIEHRAFIRHDFATADDPLRKPNKNTWATILSAQQEFESREYCDVHVWQFTPDSLLELIEGMTSLGLLERPSRCEIRDAGGQIGGLIQW
jgi:SAM-dependent methyltransferase